MGIEDFTLEEDPEDIKYFNEHKEEFIKRILARIDADDYVFCDKKDCDERGDYIKCYFDKYLDCKKHGGN